MAIKKIPCGGFYVYDSAVQNVDGKPVLNTIDVPLENAKATGGIGWTDEDYTIHKIDEKYLPEAGGGWPADLPKPSIGGYGYTDTEYAPPVFNEDVATTKQNPDDAYAKATVVLGTAFTVDDIYRVAFDGFGFHPVCRSYGPRAIGIGNRHIIATNNPDTGEPFYIEQDRDGNQTLYTASAGEFNVVVNESTKVVHKIDEKYLPSIPAAPSDDGTYTLTCIVTDGEPAYSWESAT